MDLSTIIRSSLHQNFFFIQIGANDGIANDPLNRYINAFRWKGILVEPLPDVFDRLRATYADRPELVFENVAINDVPGETDFYRHPLWDDCSGLQITTRRQRRAGDLIIKTRVVCMTLQQLLEKHKITAIDLLQIDTEGFDYNIIKQIPWQRIKPKIIHYEHKHLKHTQNDCKRLLEAQGYMIEKKGHNTLAYQ